MTLGRTQQQSFGERLRTSRFFAYWCRLPLLASTLSILSQPPSALGEALSTETSVRAAFIINFSKFVVFPDTVLPLQLCVVGEDPSLLSALKEVLSLSKNDGVAPRACDPDQAESCDIVYFAGNSTERLCRAAASLGTKPILTIAWSEGFAECGGMIELTQVDNKFRFIINRRAAERSRLQMNSQLLSLASTVINP